MRSQAHYDRPWYGPSRGRFGAAYRVLQEAIEARAFPGCAFGVLAGGQVVLAGALGRFTYEEDAPAVTAETVFDVASLTKVVATTAAAMLLVQRGQIDLDTPLGELLPGFVAGRAAGDPARHVKLRHLLAHSSGLPGYVEFFRTATTPEALLRACLELPLQAEPGARAEYSDPGFILLGKALETRMGEDLAGWLRREVFAPLGMTATGFCPAAGGASLDSAHRGRHHLSPRPNSGRGAGRKRMGDEWRGRTCRAFLQRSRPAAICRRRSQRRERAKRIRQGEAQLFRPGDCGDVCPAARAGGEFARAGLGYALRELVLWQALCAAFDRAPRLQRLFALDRPGCRDCRGAR